MFSIFKNSFVATFLSVMEIFIVILGAGIAMRRKWITQEQVTAMSKITVLVFLPCMMFANIVESFKPGEQTFWWVLPLASLLLTGIGIALGALFFRNRLPVQKNLLALTGFQNATYLVLPVGMAIFPKEFARFALYDFLFVIGLNLLLWSLGKFLATEQNAAVIGWRDFLTPPAIANVLAVGLVLLHAQQAVPLILVNATRLLGAAAVPVATFVLGAVLGSIPLRIHSVRREAWGVLGIKLLILPALTFATLVVFHIGVKNPLLARFFLIQSAAAPAVGIILQVRSYGGDEEKIGTLMLLSYMACVLTMPAWLALFDMWALR